jgi:hypothetical protein
MYLEHLLFCVPELKKQNSGKGEEASGWGGLVTGSGVFEVNKSTLISILSKGFLFQLASL